EPLGLAGRLTPVVRGLARKLAGDFGVLWIAGAVVAEVLVCDRLLPLDGEAYEWAQYLLLATLLPLMLAAALFAGRRWSAAGRAVKLVLAGVAVTGAWVLAYRQTDHLWLVAAAVQT